MPNSIAKGPTSTSSIISTGQHGPSQTSYKARPLAGQSDLLNSSVAKDSTVKQHLQSEGTTATHLSKPIAPTVNKIENKHSDFLLTNYLDGRYTAPETKETLSQLCDRSFALGLPFFVALKAEGYDDISIPSAHPASLLYRQVDERNSRDTDGITSVYLLKKNTQAAEFIGTINDLESEKNPLGFHLLLLNDPLFDLADKENLRGESLAAASILFRLGICVHTDPAVADQLLALLPKEDRNFHFGRAMIDALLEKDYRCATACMDFGADAFSVDDHGHFAFSCALDPEAKDFLENLLSKVTTAEHVGLLEAQLRFSKGHLDQEVETILAKHVIRLRNL